MGKVKCRKCSKILGCVFPDLDWEHKCDHCELKDDCKIQAEQYEAVDIKCVNCITEDEEIKGVRDEKTKQ